MKRRILTAVAALTIAALTSPLLRVAGAATDALPSGDRADLSTAYTRLTTTFYKKLPLQRVLNGVRYGLVLELAHERVAKRALPPLLATGSTSGNLRAIEYEIDRARALGGKNRPLQPYVYAALWGMMYSAHDRWTVFLDPKDYKALNNGLDGTNFGGTGIVIQPDNKTKFISVYQVVPGGPADKAGIQQDDLITAVNGKSTYGITTADASKELRGKIGTQVTLTVERDGALLPKPIVLTRAKIHQITVFDKMLPGKIGYVALTVFGETTGAELTTALSRLHKEGARAFVLDLRNNGGGYLQAAVSVSSKFIAEGPIVSIETSGKHIDTLEADGTAISPVPLVVLVNGYTASASEITTAALKESGTAVVIGTKTFGKGVVQTLFPLRDGGAVKITTARYLTPEYHYINHKGIIPNIVVAENKNAEFGRPAHDVQLKRAIEVLDGEITAQNSGATTKM